MFSSQWIAVVLVSVFGLTADSTASALPRRTRGSIAAGTTAHRAQIAVERDAATPAVGTTAPSATDADTQYPAAARRVVGGFGVPIAQIAVARAAWTDSDQLFRQALTRDGQLITIGPNGVRVVRAMLATERSTRCDQWQLPRGRRVMRSSLLWDQR
jgi:hypothetical protein